MNAQLMIDGKAIHGHELNVSSVLIMPKADLSGQSSATDKADLGIKPKKVTVSLSIPFSKKTWLREIVQLSEARDENGAALHYVIVDLLCDALNIRQVTFSDSVNIFEHDQTRAWDVSFTLSEYKSPAEVAESRAASRGDASLGTSFATLAAQIDEVVT